jgi:hypothetical protein
MKRLYIWALALGVVGTVAGSIFYSCQKETVQKQSSIEEMQVTNNIQHKEGEIVGWVVITSDGQYTSAANGCSGEGQGCLPEVKVEYYDCYECMHPDKQKDAKPLYNSTGGGNGNGNGSGNGTGNGTGTGNNIVGNLYLHKVLIDQMALPATEIRSFVKKNKDTYIKFIKEDLINGVILGKYNMSVVSETVLNEQMFRYIICFSNAIDETDVITHVPITYIYEFK